MKFISPLEISGQIMTLISEAQDEVIIVSPYVSITTWKKMSRCLKMAIDKGVSIKMYVRKNVNDNYKPFEELGISIIPIVDLHAKIYLNESYGIVSSQNLIEYSDTNSIDFGYRTEEHKEWLELSRLISTYLDRKKLPNIIKEEIKVDKVEEPISSIQPILDENISLSKEQISLIAKKFEENFLSFKINYTAKYIYLSDAFAFGDLMLREGFEIRFHDVKNSTEKEVLGILEDLSLETFTYKYKKKMLDRDFGPAYVRFTPIAPSNLDLLTADYIALAKQVMAKTSKVYIKKTKW